MKLSDYVIDFIVKQGVHHIFEMAGGAITHLLDSTYHRNDIACVSVHHEQAGAFAAEGYARMNGRLGVAMATSGPGALNLLTGIGSCYFDSVPCLFITGQVNTYEYKFDRPLRQIGFQETDIVSVAKPLVKYAAMVTSPERIRYELEKAVCLARMGRPGPVLLDIPLNVQRADIAPEQLPSFEGSAEREAMTRRCSWGERLATLTTRLAASRRPLVLAGGGVRLAGAEQELLALLERTGMPVVASLMGLDAVPHEHSSFYGMIGSYGNRYANLAVANCDFLLVLGSRLDTRQTGTRPDSFSRQSYKAHVDIDAAELGAKVAVDLALQGDVRAFLREWLPLLSLGPEPAVQQADLVNWLAILDGYRSRYPDVPQQAQPETSGHEEQRPAAQGAQERAAELAFGAANNPQPQASGHALKTETGEADNPAEALSPGRQEAEPKTGGGAKAVQPKAGPMAQAKPEVKPQAKPEAKPQVKLEAKPQVKPEVKPQVKLEVKPEAKPQVKLEVKPEAKPQAPEPLAPPVNAGSEAGFSVRAAETLAGFSPTAARAEPPLEPNRLMRLISGYCGPSHAIVLDVGQHQMWASQSFRVQRGQRLLNSGGMGAMGFALPAAVGAAMAAPERDIIVIAGDGGFQLNIQELETVRYHQLPIKIFVLDNNNLGMVRQFQDLYFDGRRQSSSKGYSCPDLVRIAAAYGIEAATAQSWAEAEQHIQEALAAPGPRLVRIVLPEDTVVSPKLVVNHPVEDMSPPLSREELRRMMVIDLWDGSDDGNKED